MDDEEKPAFSVAELRRSFMKSNNEGEGDSVVTRSRPPSGAWSYTKSVSPRTSEVSPRTSAIVQEETAVDIKDEEKEEEKSSSVAELRRSFIKSQKEGEGEGAPRSRPPSGAWSYTQGVSPRTSAVVREETTVDEKEEEEDERAKLPPVKLIGFEGVAGPPPNHALYPDVSAAQEDSTAVDVPPEVPATNVSPIGFEGTVAGIDNEAYDGDEPTVIPPATKGEELGVPGGEENGDIALLGYKTKASSITTGLDLLTEPLVDDGHAPVKSESSLNGSKLELAEKRETLFFKDGVRRIDYILVYKDTSDESKRLKRETFEKNLEEEGLELEYEDKKLSQDKKSNFVKIHAPWDVLTKVAEILALKMPIKENDLEEFQGGCCSKFPNPFELSTDLVPEEPDCFTADFSREREHMFVIKDKETFFTNAQRSLIVYELLLRTKYTEDKDKFGVDRLTKQGVYTAAFPLHEGPYLSEHSLLTEGPANDRHLLYEVWARPKRWYCYQPLDLIRRYFGEKIAIYFTWLGFYTAMLIPAAFVGLVAFIYGAATVLQNPPSNEICDKNGAGNFTMCPLCDKYCPWWKLVDSCLYSQFTYLFDNEATVFFAAFMAIWATCFLEFWKRKQAELQYDWDVADFELEEHMRPEYEIKCKHRKKNPVTQLMEPFVPIWSKIPRRCTSIVVVLFMICCVLAALFGVIMYRMIVVAVLYSVPDKYVRSSAKMITTCTAAILNLILILLLNKIYERLAVRLTEMERPRTDTDFEDSFTFKMFLFQFINYYSSIFYIAFFKGRLRGSPGRYNYSLQFRQDECDPAGCLIELCIQLAIVMVGKQTFNNFKEFLLPKILTWCRSKNALKNETEENLYTRWEQDNDLAETPALGLFEEYLEMVIQYGFVTIFVAAFPLAPLFALLNNIVEIRLDAYKFIVTWKRPAAVRAQDIGIWFGILKGVSFIAVLSNAFIIGWTSDFVPKLVYKYAMNPQHTLSGYVNSSLSVFLVSDFQNQSIPENLKVEEFGVVNYCRYKDYREPYSSPNKYEYTRIFWNVFAARLAFVIVFEHVVFFLTWLVAYLIPDVPSRVKQLMLREVYLAKEARYAAALHTVDQENRKKTE